MKRRDDVVLQETIVLKKERLKQLLELTESDQH